MSNDAPDEPSEIRTRLDQAAETRRSVALAGRRPVWTEILLAVTLGSFIPLTLFGDRSANTVGVVLFVLGVVGFAVAQRTVTRRRGQLMDGRARIARLVHLIPLALAALLVALFPPPPDWQPWYGVGVGIAFAAGSFLWLRWSGGYHIERLAAGDYDPGDLK